MSKVTVIPIVLEHWEAISKRFRVEHVQKTVRGYYDITILRFNITIGS